MWGYRLRLGNRNIKRGETSHWAAKNASLCPRIFDIPLEVTRCPFPPSTLSRPGPKDDAHSQPSQRKHHYENRHESPPPAPARPFCPGLGQNSLLILTLGLRRRTAFQIPLPPQPLVMMKLPGSAPRPALVMTAVAACHRSTRAARRAVHCRGG